MGSVSDSRIMNDAAKILDEFNIYHDDQIISAHRTPNRLKQYTKHAEIKNFKIIIAGAGGAAHLPGMISSFTLIPVIGIPILVYNDIQNKKFNVNTSAFNGLDSLLSISEMPRGSAIATVGINKAGNAALYAIKILANEFPNLKSRLSEYKKKQYDDVLQESKKIEKNGITNFLKMHD